MPDIKNLLERVAANVERVLVGKGPTVQYVLVALIAQGHVLLEDLPGMGKTTLVRALAASLGCQFRRIQFTPDLLPSDITGVSIFNQSTGGFEFRPGPVFGQIVLADEINRTTPKTQSALLECMEERQITVDGTTWPLPRPFLVLATQNPIEHEGTFRLPEAMLDRFFLRLQLGYPSHAEELRILREHGRLLPEHLKPVITAPDLIRAQTEAANIYIEASVEDYLLQIVRHTRRHPDLVLGASPRAALSLMRAAQGLALLRGRPFVTPDLVKEMAPPVIGHRLILRPEAEIQGLKPEAIISEIIASIPVPTGVRIHARTS